MARHFKPARFPHGEVPLVTWLPYKTGETFLIGAVLAYDTSQVVEASADPTAIVGVAAQSIGTAPGYELGFASQIQQVTGRKQEIPVFMADGNVIWSGGGSSAFASTDINTQYGIVKSGTVWIIDKTETGTVSVEIVDLDPYDTSVAYFKWIAAALAQPA